MKCQIIHKQKKNRRGRFEVHRNMKCTRKENQIDMCFMLFKLLER